MKENEAQKIESVKGSKFYIEIEDLIIDLPKPHTGTLTFKKFGFHLSFDTIRACADILNEIEFNKDESGRTTKDVDLALKNEG